jgi:hypothetical protein
MKWKAIIFLTYLKIAKWFPRRFRENVERMPLHPFNLMERYCLWKAERSGPPFRPSHRKIIIDITAACNFCCTDCNRSCAPNQAPSKENMDIAQIEKFLNQSIQQGRIWEEICIEGGEPTLHPQLKDIVSLLIKYKKRYSPKTFIKIQTNGFGEKNRTVVADLPIDEVYVYNSGKSSNIQQKHLPFNVAPCDEADFCGCDYSIGCFLPACYGLGLNRNGFYPHPICGGIDRVLGLDIGRKKLPHIHDSMRDHFRKLCPLCGFFRFMIMQRNKKRAQKQFETRQQRNTISGTWLNVYEQYRRNPPRLSKY